MKKATRILLVEDDWRLARLIKDFLGEHGYYVDIEARGDAVLSRLHEWRPDLIILDVMLPGLSGFSLCSALKAQFTGPILMLTALGSSEDQIRGLELGADDYMVKPVHPPLLLARINSLLRRFAPATPPSGTLAIGKLALDQDNHEARYDGQAIALTRNEFTLLWFLASNAGQILSREQLYPALLGQPYDGIDRRLDLRIFRLRKKLNDEAEPPRRIKTLWGKGYLFAPDAWND